MHTFLCDFKTKKLQVKIVLGLSKTYHSSNDVIEKKPESYGFYL